MEDNLPPIAMGQKREAMEKYDKRKKYLISDW